MDKVTQNKQIIIVDSDEEETENNPAHHRQGQVENLVSPTKVIQVKSNRKLSETDLGQNCQTVSPTEFSKREHHKILVYSDEEDERCCDDHIPEQCGKSETSSNRQTKPTKTIEEPEEELQSMQFEVPIPKVEEPMAKKSQQIYYSRRKSKRRTIKFEEEQPEEEMRNRYDHDEIVQSEEEEEEEQEESQEEVYDEKVERRNYERRPSQKLPEPINFTFSKGQIQKILMAELPKGYKLSCLINVQSGLLGFTTKYNLSLKTDPMLLLSAKKQFLSLSPNFLISKSKINHSQRNQAYVGRLQGNFSGSEWVLETLRPDRESHEAKIYAKYEESLMGSISIRTMEAIKKDPTYTKRSKYTLTQKVEANSRVGLVSLKTVTPTLKNGKYHIDFKGHAKRPSNKNFILAFGEERNECLIMAKQAEKLFLMEVRYPLTVLEGFALCLSSLDGKLFVN